MRAVLTKNICRHASVNNDHRSWFSQGYRKCPISHEIWKNLVPFGRNNVAACFLCHFMCKHTNFFQLLKNTVVTSLIAVHICPHHPRMSTNFAFEFDLIED